MIEYIDENIKVLHELKNYEYLINEIANNLIECFKRGNKLLLIGNGGSASDANHIAAELAFRLKKDRMGLPAIALTNISTITAIANDKDYLEVFSKQIIAYGNKGDTLIALSTSGKSKNIVNSIETAKSLDINTLLITGNNTDTYADMVLNIPSDQTPIIQNAYMLIMHEICDRIEEYFYENRD